LETIMAIHAPITPAPAVAPSLIIQDVSCWLSQAKAIVQLILETDTTGSTGIEALFAVQGLLETAAKGAGAAEVAVMALERLD
jgi:hypothetical protein